MLGEVLGDLRQLRAFATLLESIARDTARPAWERAWAIRLRGPLPGGADVLGRLVHRPGSDGPEAVTVVEAALAALGHADDPRAAVAVLLAHVDGDHARVAVPATRRCVDLLAPAEVAAPLARLLASPKVTTRKDAVRLTVDHRRPDAAQQLLTCAITSAEHRDVRRAAVAAAVELLRGPADASAVWEVLRTAADEPDLATAVLGTTPRSVPEAARERYGRIVLDMCRDRPDRSTDDTRRALAEIAVAHAVDWTRPEATHDDLRGVAARRARGDARDVVIDPE